MSHIVEIKTEMKHVESLIGAATELGWQLVPYLNKIPDTNENGRYFIKSSNAYWGKIYVSEKGEIFVDNDIPKDTLVKLKKAYADKLIHHVARSKRATVRRIDMENGKTKYEMTVNA